MAEKDFRYIVRVANTDLDGKKKLLTGMTKIKGIKMMYANMVCNLAGVDSAKRVGDLEDSDVEKLNSVIANPKKFGAPEWMLNRRKDYGSGESVHLVTTDLVVSHEDDLKRLKKIKSYRGFRHTWGQPVRGQRTKANFRKNKGKGMGVKKKLKPKV